MPFVIYFEMNIGIGVLSIDIYNFIRAKQNDISGAELIYIEVQSRTDEFTRASNIFNRANTGQILLTCTNDTLQ